MDQQQSRPTFVLLIIKANEQKKICWFPFHFEMLLTQRLVMIQSENLIRNANTIASPNQMGTKFLFINEITKSYYKKLKLFTLQFTKSEKKKIQEK